MNPILRFTSSPRVVNFEVMTTLAEIETAVSVLSTEELHNLERTLHKIYQQRGAHLLYDDRHGTTSEEDLIAEADIAFMAYDRAEEAHARGQTR